MLNGATASMLDPMNMNTPHVLGRAPALAAATLVAAGADAT
jgi:hypothetical protein